MLRRGFQLLGFSRRAPRSSGSLADVVLGPTADGGYWSIGVRRLVAGLLRDVAWSTEWTLQGTVERCRKLGLSVRFLDRWTDVDRPEDLFELRRQILGLRARGDTRTARHVEALLPELGYPLSLSDDL
jgi:hypothetical protein